MTVTSPEYARNVSMEGRAMHVINRFVIVADRLRNANGATKIGVVTVTHLALGAEMVGVATALTVLRRRMMYKIQFDAMKGPPEGRRRSSFAKVSV